MFKFGFGHYKVWWACIGGTRRLKLRVQRGVCHPIYFLKSWLWVHRQPWRAYIMCVVGFLCRRVLKFGAARVTWRRLRGACAILSASLLQSPPSYFLLPPSSQGKCVCACVSLPAKFMFTPCAGSAPANLSGKSLPATRRMKSSRGAPNQKEIIFACQSTQFSTRRNRKSYTKKPTTVEIP